LHEKEPQYFLVEAASVLIIDGLSKISGSGDLFIYLFIFTSIWNFGLEMVY